jgi:hypothetical protein
MKTKLESKIPKSTRAILYLCELKRDELIVKGEGLFDNVMHGLDAYANIRNPESQLITGKTYDELIVSLEVHHAWFKNKQWLDNLRECL